MIRFFQYFVIETCLNEAAPSLYFEKAVKTFETDEGQISNNFIYAVKLTAMHVVPLSKLDNCCELQVLHLH